MGYVYEDVVGRIVGQPLRGYGENRMTQCPLHVDRSPSLSVNVDTGAWICFSCGEKGGLEHLTKVFEVAISEEERVELASRTASRLDTEVQEPVDFMPLMQSFDYRPSIDTAGPFYRYLLRKNLERGVVEHFRLGWSDERSAITMPYYDDDEVVAIKYRFPDGGQKFATGSRRVIYNIDECRGAPVVVLCEGESDTQVVWQALRDTGVAVGGIPGASSRREAWELRALDLIFAKHIFIAFDNDAAGDKGASLALDVLGQRAHRLAPPSDMGKDWSDALTTDFMSASIYMLTTIDEVQGGLT